MDFSLEGLSTCVQSCFIPASCVHAIKLDAEYQDNNGKVTIHKEYAQNKEFDDVYLYDTTGKGANLTVELIGKGCVTENPDCPSGVLSSDYSAKKIKAGAPFKETLNFPKTDSKISKFINFIKFIDGCILGSVKSLPAVKYDLLFSECNGEKGVGELFKIIQSGEKTSLSPVRKGKIVSSSSIFLFPRVKWKADVAIALSRTIERIEKKRHRRKRKRIITKVKESDKACVSVTNTTTLTIGDTSHEFTKKMAEKDYTYHSSESKFLTNLKKVKTLSEGFAKGDDPKIKLVTSTFVLPTITFTGQGALAFSTQHQPYINSSATIDIKDLLNFSITVNALEAFAVAFGVGPQVVAALELGKKLEQKFKENKSGLYWGGQCDLTFKAMVSAKFVVASTEIKPWDVKVEPLEDITITSDKEEQKEELKAKKNGPNGVNASISLSALINVRLGSKINVVQGPFEGEKSLGVSMKAEGTATLEGCVTIEGNGDKTELILHHKGIWAEVTLEWEVIGELSPNNARSKKSKMQNPQKKQTKGADEKALKGAEKGTESKKWQIYPPCKKEDSKIRTFLFEKNEETELRMSHEYYNYPYVKQNKY